MPSTQASKPGYKGSNDMHAQGYHIGGILADTKGSPEAWGFLTVNALERKGRLDDRQIGAKECKMLDGRHDRSEWGLNKMA